MDPTGQITVALAKTAGKMILSHVAKRYLDKQGPFTFRKCNSEDGTGPNDAIVIHGMRSTGLKLQNFGNGLVHRNCHRNIWLMTLRDNDHYYVPQIRSLATAEIAAESIMQNIATGRVKPPIDLIGHSNGGYVVAHLTNLMPAGTLRQIVTLGTPSGLYEITPDWDNVAAISHFVGMQDRIVKYAPWITGRDGANPTDSRTYFVFPDDNHSSIHEEADNNGVADIVSFICGAESRHVFASRNDNWGTVLHIWPWCRHEFGGEKLWLRSQIPERKFTVCDGLHQDYALKHFRRSAIPVLSIFPNIINYWRISNRLNAALDETKEQLAMARWERTILREEISALNKEIKSIEKASKTLLQKTVERHRQLLCGLQTRRGFVLHLLEEADDICSTRGDLTPEQLTELKILLGRADQYYGEFISLIHSEHLGGLPLLMLSEAKN